MQRMILRMVCLFLPGLLFAQFKGQYPAGSAQTVITGARAGEQAGYHLSFVGDVNADGIDDFLISAPFSSRAGKENGQVSLFFGRSQWPQELDINQADVVLVGEKARDWASHDVFGLGDVNGDHIDDFGIGVKFVDQSAFNAGKNYIFFGKNSDWPDTLSLAAADASFLGENASAEAGHIASAGDIDKDGLNDILIGAGFDDKGGADAGQVYVIMGRTGSWPKNASLASADYNFTGEQAGDFAGHRLSGAGDVNGDGLADFIIGAHGADRDSITNRGMIYLLLGRREGWAKNSPLSVADASFIGPRIANSSVGWNLCGCGDVNGDGFDDMLMASQNKSAVYLVLGKAEGWLGEVDLEMASATKFIGEAAADHAGYDMRSLGDLDQDGLDDFMIGAYGNDASAPDAGRAYLIMGRSSWPAQYKLAQADALFNGETAGDQLGWAVAGNGDVNQDGFADILLGANMNDAAGENAGKAYLFLTPPIYFTLLYPNGGEVWHTGTVATLSWAASNPEGQVRIELSRDGGASWEILVESTADDGAEDWLVTGAASNQALIRIRQLATGRQDESNALFSIVAPALQVLAPNGAESWLTGSRQTIAWSWLGQIQAVKLELSLDNGRTWSVLSDSSENNGTYPWTIDADLVSDSCLVRIVALGASAAATSNATFRLLAPPAVTVRSPNGGEVWRIGETMPILWESINNSGQVRIEMSRDAGVIWEVLAASIPDSGRFLYTVSGLPSDSCLVRVLHATGTPADTSDALFGIEPVPALTLIAPNGAELWIVRSTQAITWQSTNIKEGIKIELSRNQGQDWEIVADSLEDTGMHQWQITDPISAACLMRISTASGSLSDRSDQAFAIEYPTEVAAAQAAQIPQAFALQANYPNPFNPETRIHYQVPAAAWVRIRIYNTAGQLVKTLLEQKQAAGYHMTIWDGRTQNGQSAPSGMYLCRMEAEGFAQTRQMLLLK